MDGNLPEGTAPIAVHINGRVNYNVIEKIWGKYNSSNLFQVNG
jgi:hypothetical protein